MPASKSDVVESLRRLEPVIKSRYGPSLLKIRHRFDADDLVQTTAYKAMRGVSQCQASSREELDHWILTIANKSRLNALKEHTFWQKRATHFEVQLVEPHGDCSTSYEELPEVKAAILEELELLESCLDRLSPRRRSVLKMRLAGRSYKEVSVELKCSMGAVRAIVSRAIGDLRREMTQQSPPDEE